MMQRRAGSDLLCCCTAFGCGICCQYIADIYNRKDHKSWSVFLSVAILVCLAIGATLTAIGCSPNVPIATCIDEPILYGVFNGISTNTVCCAYSCSGSKHSDCTNCVIYGCLTFDVKYRLYATNATSGSNHPVDACIVDTPRDTVYLTYDSALKDAQLLYNKTHPSKLVKTSKTECKYYGSYYSSRVVMYGFGVTFNVLAALLFLWLLYVLYEWTVASSWLSARDFTTK